MRHSTGEIAVNNYVAKIFIATTLVLTLSSHANEGDTISGAEILAVSADLACLEWTAVGVCLWMTCTLVGCDFDYSIKVKHYIPDAVVSSYKNTGENPWTDVRSYSPPNSQAEDGGSNTEGTQINEQALRFKNADVIGSPGNSLFESLHNSTEFFCDPGATSYAPYYLSVLDYAWRDPTLETAWTISNFGRSVSKGLTHFGPVYPRIGFVHQGHDYKSAVVTAQRAADIVTRSNQPHVYWPMVWSAEQGYWPPGPVQEGNAATHKWQQLVPRGNSTGCVVFPDIDDTAYITDPFSSRVNQSTGYAWNLWRPYVCCERAGAILVFHSGG